MQGNGVHGMVVASDLKSAVEGVAVLVVAPGVQIDERTPSNTLTLADGSFRVECPASSPSSCLIAVRRDGVRFEPSKQSANVNHNNKILIIFFLFCLSG